MTFEVLTKHLGGLRGIRAACVFSLYERTLKSGELLMDGIVVDANARGSGIGTMLLDALVTFASDSGYTSVRLDVIDTNPRARRMYEQNSFVATSSESFGYLRWLLGFGGSTTLVRDAQSDG
jgi:ribosomal protein S18 acetylase RimI-like enzyme